MFIYVYIYIDEYIIDVATSNIQGYKVTEHVTAVTM